MAVYGKVSGLSTHSAILNNVEKIPIKHNEELNSKRLIHILFLNN